MKRNTFHALALLLLSSVAVGARDQDQAIQEHIPTIRTHPSLKAKRAANEALAEIGLPALVPLMDYLHQVAQAKPNDENMDFPRVHSRRSFLRVQACRGGSRRSSA